MMAAGNSTSIAARRAISAMNLNRLDLNLLVALDVLLTERSITHAAEHLNLSPSATSGALARLRVFFDDELLTQIGRRMAPTPLGESLQASVRDCLLHVQATIDIRPQFDPLNSKRNFRLMMSDYVSTVLMPGALRRLQREAPGITIELLANENEPWQALSRGRSIFWCCRRTSYAKAIPQRSCSKMNMSASVGAKIRSWPIRSPWNSVCSWVMWLRESVLCARPPSMPGSSSASGMHAALK